jgi:hypothetical protein
VRGNVRIRAYRGGCWLISLPGSARVLAGGPTPAAAKDARRDTGRLDLIAGGVLEGVEAGEIWLPWIEDPADPLAAKLQKRRRELEALLDGHFAALKGRRPLRKPARSPAPNARYLAAGTEIRDAAGIPGLRARVLRPPRDAEMLAKLDPPAGQRCLRPGRGGMKYANAVAPFARKWRVEERPPASLSPAEERALHGMERESVERLASALRRGEEAARLVVAFEFAGRALPLPVPRFQPGELWRDEAVTVPRRLWAFDTPSRLQRSPAAPTGTRSAGSPFPDAA